MLHHTNYCHRLEDYPELYHLVSVLNVGIFVHITLQITLKAFNFFLQNPLAQTSIVSLLCNQYVLVEVQHQL
jgi:hypothetical protein